MNRTFHIILGITIVVVHSYVLAHLTELMPAFGPHHGVLYSADAESGQDIFKMLPFIASGFFLFADYLSAHRSPVSQLTGKPLFGRGVWYLFGYGLLLVSIGLYLLFSSV